MVGRFEVDSILGSPWIWSHPGVPKHKLTGIHVNTLVKASNHVGLQSVSQMTSGTEEIGSIALIPSFYIVSRVVPLETFGRGE